MAPPQRPPRPRETARIFPLSNWTERDVWRYIAREGLEVVPLYLAAERPTVLRDGRLIVRDDDRMPLLPGESETVRKVRFRTLGCCPLTAAEPSEAATLDEVIEETHSPRATRSARGA